MMEITLGKMGMIVNKNGFGALPIQRIPAEDAVYLIKKAYEGGITFSDTARNYTDSGEKLGAALEGIRDRVFIAIKIAVKIAEKLRENLETFLKNLRTDHVDLYPFHDLSFRPKSGDGTGLYETVLEAKEQGKVCHIGIANHRLSVAMKAIDSGIYETLQSPPCYPVTDKDLELVEQCREAGTRFIAMKTSSGDLINSPRAAYVYLARFDNVLLIRGVQGERELDGFLSHVRNPSEMTDEIGTLVDRDRKEPLGEFCRDCGYCMPYSMGIEINNCIRTFLIVRRAPPAAWLASGVREKTRKIERYLHCS